ncbi:MAG: glycosyltransferase family 2 protein [Pseudomonadota bacterium]
MKYNIDQYNIVYDKAGPVLDRLNFLQLESSEPSGAETPIESRPDFPRLGPELSFRSGLDASQSRGFTLAMAVLGLSLISYPMATLVILFWLLYLIFSLLLFWRGLLILVGACIRLTKRPAAPVRPPEGPAPVYTILVPLYKESRIVPQLAHALSQLNWPADRLDIQILLEADDPETLEAVRNAAFPPSTRVQTIPAGGPRTKPNALNYGLTEAVGRYITVYDAEDIPHPDQLLAAYHAFQLAPPDLVCVQAPLIGDAATGGWLGAQWALEYSVQFGLLLPSLALYRMPLLIGGTSNHFRKDALQALGGWDSWNVTEDADLGMRIARAGLISGTISPPTIETTPTRLSVWLAQRSRWIKGFTQTWLVLMRTPAKTRKQMGVRGDNHSSCHCSQASYCGL